VAAESAVGVDVRVGGRLMEKHLVGVDESPQKMEQKLVPNFQGLHRLGSSVYAGNLPCLRKRTHLLE